MERGDPDGHPLRYPAPGVLRGEGNIMKQRRRFAAVCLLLLSFMVLSSGCGSNGENLPPPDLRGRWVQEGSETSTYYQVAEIDGDRIECYWHVAEDGKEHLYWSGSYIPPTNGKEPYRWTSQRNEYRSGFSSWARTEDELTFTYEDGKLHYISIQGRLRLSVSLVREE